MEAKKLSEFVPASVALPGTVKAPWSPPRVVRLVPGSPEHERARAAIAAAMLKAGR